MKFSFHIQSPDATATEGFSGVEDLDLPSVEAAVAQFAARVIAEPGQVHILTGLDGYKFAMFEPQ